MTTTLIIALVLAWSIQTVFMWKRARLLRAEIVELRKANEGARVLNKILLRELNHEDDFTAGEEWPEIVEEKVS